MTQFYPRPQTHNPTGLPTQSTPLASLLLAICNPILCWPQEAAACSLPSLESHFTTWLGGAMGEISPRKSRELWLLTTPTCNPEFMITLLPEAAHSSPPDLSPSLYTSFLNSPLSHVPWIPRSYLVPLVLPRSLCPLGGGWS